MENNGKIIVGEFQTNGGDILDSFTLQKSWYWIYEYYKSIFNPLKVL